MSTNSKEIIVEVNDYTFSVKPTTGTTTAKGTLQNEKSTRNNTLQKNAGGVLREMGEEGGHLVATRLNGPAIPENHFAQVKSLNRSQFKVIENAEHRLISNAEHPASIQTERIAFMSHAKREDGVHPDAFMINDTITYPSGSEQKVHFSFANISNKDQEKLNQELDTKIEIEDIANPNDFLRESMSIEEYAELMEETDEGLPTLRDEFEEHITTSNTNWDFDNTQYKEEISCVYDNWDFEQNNDVSNNVEISSSENLEIDTSTDVANESSTSAEADTSPDNDCE